MLVDLKREEALVRHYVSEEFAMGAFRLVERLIKQKRTYKVVPLNYTVRIYH